MPFYYVRLADKPVQFLTEKVRYRNIVLTNEFDSPELMYSLIDRMGFSKMPEGTKVIKTENLVTVVQKIIVKFDKQPTIKQLDILNAQADKALFDASLAAKTFFDVRGNEIK